MLLPLACATRRFDNRRIRRHQLGALLQLLAQGPVFLAQLRVGLVLHSQGSDHSSKHKRAKNAEFEFGQNDMTLKRVSVTAPLPPPLRPRQARR